MRVHGFWPAGEGLPQDPPAEAAARSKIEAELKHLEKNARAIADPAEALAAERKRRWEESKARRAATKALRADQARARHAAWEAKKQASLVHAGDGVSSGL